MWDWAPPSGTRLPAGLLTGKYNDGNLKARISFQYSGFEWLKDKTLADEKINKVRAYKKVADELGASMA